MFEAWNCIAQFWWDWMLQITLQSGLLILLILLLEIPTRRRLWPQFRWALWLLVILRLILPPGLSASTSLTAPLYQTAFRVLQPATPSPFQARVESLASKFSSPSRKPIPLTSNRVAPAVAGSDRGKSTPAGPAGSLSVEVNWKGVAMAVWAVVAGGLLATLAWSSRRWRRELLRDAGPNPKAAGLLAEWTDGDNCHGSWPGPRSGSREGPGFPLRPDRRHSPLLLVYLH